MLGYAIVKFGVSIPLNSKQWKILYSLDAIKVIESLEALGASNVDWDGHFDRFIYFECGVDNESDAEYGNRERVNEIVEKIELILGR